MLPLKFTGLAALVLLGCESASGPQVPDGFEYCGNAGYSRAKTFEYNADDSLVRIRTFGKDGIFYEYRIQYANGRMISESGKGIPPGPGRPDLSAVYTYDASGTLVKLERNFAGQESCSDYVNDSAARMIKRFQCGTDTLLSVSILDSLGRHVSDSSYSGGRTVFSYWTFNYDDSGSVLRWFYPSIKPVEPMETSVYGADGELRSLRSWDTSDSTWQTTVYTRKGPVETYETIKDDGTRLESGYSDLSPRGKPLKTISCSWL